MIAMSTRPPMNSASVNCQPISTHITIPSSTTRFVEAELERERRRRRGALLKQALGNRDRRIAARRGSGAEAGRYCDRAKPDPPSAFWMRSRGTHACTIAEMAKPSTSAHHTSQAIRKASLNPSPIVVNTPVTGFLSRTWTRN